MKRVTIKEVANRIYDLTGHRVTLSKSNGVYYWQGDITHDFSESCIHIMDFKGLTIDWLVSRFMGSLNDLK